MNHFIIGDIHGCPTELCELVALCYNHVKGPIHFVFVGDLIDKGPGPLEVLKVVETLKREIAYSDDKVSIVFGNHEEKLWRFIEHEKKVRGLVNYTNPMRRKPDWPDKLINYCLETKVLDLFQTHVYLAEFNILVVHAGIEPKLKELPPLNHIGMNKKYKSVLYTRYVDPKTGALIPLGREKQGDPWWTDLYDGRFGTVVYGHQAHKEVHYSKHAIGIDTGCVYGGSLTAYHVESKDLLQVKALKAYCNPYSGESW